MVRQAMTIVSGCYKEAADWTIGQIENDIVDRHGIAYAVKTKHMVLPMRQLMRRFYEAGYGDKAISKWINTFNDAGILTWNLLSADKQYVCFLDCPISETDLNILTGILDRGTQNKLPAEASA